MDSKLNNINNWWAKIIDNISDMKRQFMLLEFIKHVLDYAEKKYAQYPDNSNINIEEIVLQQEVLDKIVAMLSHSLNKLDEEYKGSAFEDDLRNTLSSTTTLKLKVDEIRKDRDTLLLEQKKLEETMNEISLLERDHKKRVAIIDELKRNISIIQDSIEQLEAQIHNESDIVFQLGNDFAQASEKILELNAAFSQNAKKLQEIYSKHFSSNESLLVIFEKKINSRNNLFHVIELSNNILMSLHKYDAELEKLIFMEKSVGNS
jgi:chromosome segregation ATPase